MGTILYELLIGYPPFNGLSRKDLKKNVEKGTYKIPKELNLSLECLDFLNQCLKFEAMERASLEILIKHPFISSEVFSNGVI